MIKLGVNIDHVATLRQARRQGIPDIVQAARAVSAGGADIITVHLRRDRRHIQDSDLYLLKKNSPLPLNMEMAADRDITGIALDVRPASVCLVPENRMELTTEGGLNVKESASALEETLPVLKKAGIEVSFFIDPLKEQVRASYEAGADAVELHTGSYADSGPETLEAELNRLREAAALAVELGLKLNAGHGLDYSNLIPVRDIPGISELNIGYSIVCRAIFTGLEAAVREMKELIL